MDEIAGPRKAGLGAVSAACVGAQLDAPGSARDNRRGMTAENVELMRAGQQHFVETGEPAWENIHPDVEVRDHDIPDAGSYRGLDGVARWLRQWGEAWESFELGPTRFIDAGDKVVGLFTLTATGKGSGVKVERDDAIVWTLRDGKIVELDYFNNTPDALAAAGLAQPR